MSAPRRSTSPSGAVADRAFRTDHGVLAGEAVHHVRILDVRALLDAAPEVPAKRGARADVHARTDDHVADENRARMHVRARVHDGVMPSMAYTLGMERLFYGADARSAAPCESSVIRRHHPCVGGGGHHHWAPPSWREAPPVRSG